MTSSRGGSGGGSTGGGNGGMTLGSFGVDRSRALLPPRFLFLLLDACFVDDNEEEDDARADGVSYMKCRAVSVWGWCACVGVAGVVLQNVPSSKEEAYAGVFGNVLDLGSFGSK